MVCIVFWVFWQSFDNSSKFIGQSFRSLWQCFGIFGQCFGSLMEFFRQSFDSLFAVFLQAFSRLSAVCMQSVCILSAVILQFFGCFLVVIWLSLDHSHSLHDMYINISSVVDFQRWWVLKSKLFAQESTCSKEILITTTLNHLWSSVVSKNQSF